MEHGTVTLTDPFILRPGKAVPNHLQEESYYHHQQEMSSGKGGKSVKSELGEDDGEGEGGLVSGLRGQAIQAMALRIGEEAKAKVSAFTVAV